MGTADDRLAHHLSWSEGESYDDHRQRLGRHLDTANSAETTQSAVGWCHSDDPVVQATGLDVLGELSQRQPELLDVLLEQAERLGTSESYDVRWSAVHWVGEHWDPRVATLLLRFVDDEDARIRWQAVVSLPHTRDGELTPEDPLVVALLCALRDTDPDVRDWAAFGLGVQLDVDSPEIRDALASLLYDDDEETDTAGEALVGLARRGDPRAIPRLMELLADPRTGNLIVEAAGETADPRLLPLLLALKQQGWEQDDEPRPEVLDEAIARCAVGERDWGPFRLP